MPSFRYRALTQTGQLIDGSINAPTAAEVGRRIEYLGLILIDTSVETSRSEKELASRSFFSRIRSEEVTAFTRDMALLIKAHARIDGALEMLSTDTDFGRLHPVITNLRARVLGGESFAEALAHHPKVFPPLYISLVRVGEVSGAVDEIMDVLAQERIRSEQMRSKIKDALRYPAFIFLAAGAVLFFFLLFVLPQFASVLRDFGAKLDPLVEIFLALSDGLKNHGDAIFAAGVAVALGGFLILRQSAVRLELYRAVVRTPPLRRITELYLTALFCRNLGLLLQCGMTLSAALKILANLMIDSRGPEEWRELDSHVRQGNKLSDALVAGNLLHPTAVRMLKLGEETGELPTLARKIAEFYEEKLQRSLDGVVAVAGPAAIIVISIVVGGLIVSVMTSLLSVSQIVG